MMTTKAEYEFNSYYTEIYFGNVAVGKTSVKHLYIKNDSKEPQLYNLVLENQSTHIFQFFTCKISNRSVKPNEIMKTTLVYKPIIANRQDTSQFKIDGSGSMHIVKVIGQCVGPVLQITNRDLLFYKFKSTTRNGSIIQIQNISDVEIIFKCDSDENKNDVFLVKPNTGTISPRSRTFLKIMFSPHKANRYVFHLFVLFMYHKPIKISIFGINEPKNVYYLDDMQFINYPIVSEDEDEVEEFIIYSETIKEAKIPITLSKNSLIFDRNHTSLPLGATNNLNQAVCLTWDKDLNNIFNINPLQVNIPAKETVLFECTVRHMPANIQSKCIYGTVEWDQKVLPKTIMVPIPIKIRLIVVGRNKSDYWLTHMEIIPNPVILPPCLKNSKTFTTFMMKNPRQLTSMYQIIPPKKTQLIVKPLRKEVSDYQIHLVQFCPKEIGILNEKWGVVLDLQEDATMFIDFKAQCDEPKLEIGDNNIVEFKYIQPKVSEYMLVLIKNPSIFKIKFYFVIPNEAEYLSVSPMEGSIHPNSEEYITVGAVGKLCLHENDIYCKFMVYENNTVMGPEYELQVTVKTPIIYAELTAIPSNVNEGDVLWNTTFKTSFCLFNFGLSYVPFTLRCDPGINIVKINPDRGTVTPQEKVEIVVEVIGKMYGKGAINISYGGIDPTADALNIFTLEYNCICNSFQVKEIVAYDFGKLFGKLTLWNSMNIDKLNEILSNIKHDETAEITMYMPEYEIEENEQYFVDFTVENNSNFELPINLKRVQLCNCEPVKVHTAPTKSKIMYFCPHREMLTISMSNKITPGISEIMSFKVKYTESNKTMLRYKLDIGNERIILISIIIKTLPAEISTLSVYCHDYTLDMGSVYIGQINPHLQLYWLYNNSNNSVTYNLDDLAITKLCNQEEFEVIKCLNPIDILPPYTNMPLLFRFVPIEAKKYEISVPVLLGDNIIQLKLIGKGVMEHNVEKSRKKYFMPPMSSVHGEHVNFTYDHIVFDTIPIWKQIEKLVFMQNPTYRIFEYEWEPIHIDGLLQVKVDPAEGILHPKESIQVMIHFTSLNEPCLTTLLLVCKLIDFTQKLLNEATLKEFNKNEKKITEEFTIIDGKEVHEANLTRVIPPPRHFYKTIALSVHSVSLTDKDINIEVNEQFKFKPYENIIVNKEKVLKSYMKKMDTSFAKEEEISQEEIDIKFDVHREKILFNSLEKLIAEVVHCAAFKHIIHHLHIKPSPFYSQIKRTETFTASDESIGPHKQLQKDAEKFLQKPMPHEISKTFDSLIMDTMMCKFKLNVHSNLDVTHEDYFKVHLRLVQEECTCINM